ncbi:hypothetical protein XENOCAPTIV_028121 [Xenoophorus captivus]|uniref:Phosphoinositide phospholipase C n=1 Tax=Xenoophorus captivus TaxID=1517983 RepID=A0ABV0RVE3_9TELE
MRVPRDGAFLVRKRIEPNSFAISFRAEGKIKHCRVQQEGQTVLLGTSEFDSLVDLISYHEKQPLYRKMKLRYPINEDTLEKIGTAYVDQQEPDYGSLYEGRNPGFYVEANQMPSLKLEEGKIMERRKKIALELSDLVIYCRPVPFDEESKDCTQLLDSKRACFRDMSSFPETKAEKYVNKIKGKRFLQYNRLQLSRIYPRGQRLDSSNYDPLPMWLCGSQLVALNFQTADKPMQMNQALFMVNGRSGYVLQPPIMRDDSFDPFDKNTLRGIEQVSMRIEVLGARHLPKHGRGIVCPLIEIEVCGAEYDNDKQKTDSAADNGLNPTWQRKSFHFTVCNSAFAFLRFGVYEIDMFNDQNFLAQATFPIQGLKTGVCSADLLPGEKRKPKCGMDVISCECFVCFCIVSGYRSVPLKNSYNEDLELASLLVYMDITRGRVGWSFLNELVLNLLIITGIKQQVLPSPR